MSVLAALSDEDRIKVTVAPVVAAALVSASADVDKSRKSEDVELAAFWNFIENLPATHQENALVSDVAEALRERSEPEFKKHRRAFEFRLGTNNRNALKEHLSSIKEAFAVLEKTADKQDAKAYKRFVFAVSETVAQAAKEAFMPLAGKVAGTESYFLRQIRMAAKV